MAWKNEATEEAGQQLGNASLLAGLPLHGSTGESGHVDSGLA